MHGLCRRYYYRICGGQHIPMYTHPQSLGRRRGYSWRLLQRQCSLLGKRGTRYLSRRLHICPTHENALPDKNPQAAEDSSYYGFCRWWFRRYHGPDKAQFLEGSAKRT